MNKLFFRLAFQPLNQGIFKGASRRQNKEGLRLVRFKLQTLPGLSFDKRVDLKSSFHNRKLEWATILIRIIPYHIYTTARNLVLKKNIYHFKPS